MAIERTVIDDKTVITPRVLTDSLKTGDTVVRGIRLMVTDEVDYIPAGCALQPWIDAITAAINNRLDVFEATAVASYVHPASHPATMITETSTLIWFREEWRVKLAGIAENANNYVHPATHSADMIVDTAAHVMMHPAERTKLAGIAENANNYVHPATHSLSILSNFLDEDGFIRPELLDALNVQRVTVRQSILSGFNCTTDGNTIADYVGAPLVEWNVAIGTNEYVFRITPSVTNPLLATSANGFDPVIGNTDSINIITTPIQTPALSTYSFPASTPIWVVLKANGTLAVVSAKPTFNSVAMVNSVPGDVVIASAIVSTSNNFFTNVVLLTPGRYITHETGYIPFDQNSVVIPNRLLTDKVMIQVLIQKQGETDWGILDSATFEDHDYNVYVTVADNFITLHTASYITQLMIQAKFRINVFRLY